MASSLPNNPSIDRMRDDARKLQRGVTASTSRAINIVRRYHPRPDVALASAPDRFALHDAQLTVARGYGFTGWPALVHYLEVAAKLSFDPDSVTEDSLAAADRFCTLSSLYYSQSDAPPRRKAAADLLTADPGLVEQHVWAAAAAADQGALANHLAARPELATTRGGPFGWVPLLYLCFGRAQVNQTEAGVLAAATLLLDTGADPNAGYLWCGLSTPFTALTGVFGEGEQGPGRQPRHPFAPALATLLLERGAHPVDQQTLYNRMFRPDDSHLQLLFAYGLADAGPSPWEVKLGEAIETREQMWKRQRDWAAAHGFTDRLELLARHGVDVAGVEVVVPSIPDDPNNRDEQGATPLHHAAWAGDLELIQRLLDAGANTSITDGQFDATPLGWAEHAYQTEAADLLRALELP
ncbi:ankyrin repeat domain-containing protein [Antrihabitans sp. YC3-6]|uniref:Ankyrin repeat domain-containing protein n=1 Tax=Antrihabitans stalagmiti TaxID=2799499 RepID=A0A934NLK6_9NOCA|nr:ankyrin repeat domain-containing protein [Antrihabitans stalagmiti]MBJ8337444.1 ankyrin repeat domain-containing protein [Antrihabitans stalagmiti]